MSPAAPARQSQRASVFLSYSRRDIEFVRRLVEAFESRGCDVYVDEDDIPAASDWRREIEDGIAGSDNIVFVLSDAFVGSEECARELEHAVATGKRLIPIARVACDGVPAALAARNWVWFRDDDDFTAAFETLLGAVATDADLTRQHSRLLLRRFDWQAHDRSAAYLLRGAELRAAQRWVVRVGAYAEPRPTAELLQFLAASQMAAARRRLALILAAGIGIAAVVAAFWWQARERTATQARHVATANSWLRRTPLRAIESALEALDLGASPDAEAALASALSIAGVRIENRRDEATLAGQPTFVGIGVSRWRTGAVYSRLRADGRFALIASERGADGASGGAGRAFLLDMDSLRTVELRNPETTDRRLEYLGFSADGAKVIVTRQFYLDVFDLEGALESTSQQGRTAQPLHIAVGFLADGWVLVCDSERQIWLAHARTGAMSRWMRRSSADGPAVLAEADPAGRRAIVAFESGRAILLEVTDPEDPTEVNLDAPGVTFATFGPEGRRLLTGDRTGLLEVWDLTGAAPERTASFSQDSPSGLARFADDGGRLIAVDQGGVLRAWDLATGELRLSRDEATK